MSALPSQHPSRIRGNSRHDPDWTTQKIGVTLRCLTCFRKWHLNPNKCINGEGPSAGIQLSQRRPRAASQTFALTAQHCSDRNSQETMRLDHNPATYFCADSVRTKNPVRVCFAQDEASTMARARRMRRKSVWRLRSTTQTEQVRDTSRSRVCEE
jgi:hypothetical protein